ncbi:MerR family transcriptional regulator [Alkalihalobacillus pseudalcaliphilus]|uniref:MerR family transcriptional regulator n=1 Tax=Alkalihalobacillus pseudalcaliphilus TaxID=79884 RepID=UPI00064DECE3|nr:MerR family transcriptional regulator [Alkalihalobacillus pseudalcaliphilus]KMK75081.1 hypothetical protein AB990_16620 [Alkalihalobacillus pseudalcaliphilus]
MGQTYSVGEFSKKTSTSVRTLHYYDEIGLLTPKKHPTTGHRQYEDQDLITLQQIVTFKWLGYSLEEIAQMISQIHDVNHLKESLKFQKYSFEQKKSQINHVIEAIDRTLENIDDKKQYDPSVFISFINGVQTEPHQKDWIAKYTTPDIADRLFSVSPERQKEIDQHYFTFMNSLKEMKNKPYDSEEAEQFIREFITYTDSFLDQELVDILKGIDDIEVEELTAYSPFMESESEWLTKAMEHYEKKFG